MLVCSFCLKEICCSQQQAELLFPLKVWAVGCVLIIKKKSFSKSSNLILVGSLKFGYALFS